MNQALDAAEEKLRNVFVAVELSAPECRALLDEIEQLRTEWEELLENIEVKQSQIDCGHDEVLRLRAERDAAYEKAAVVASAYEPRCDSCPSGVASAIRALRSKKT